MFWKLIFSQKWQNVGSKRFCGSFGNDSCETHETSCFLRWLWGNKKSPVFGYETLRRFGSQGLTSVFLPHPLLFLLSPWEEKADGSLIKNRQIPSSLPPLGIQQPKNSELFWGIFYSLGILIRRYLQVRYNPFIFQGVNQENAGRLNSYRNETWALVKHVNEGRNQNSLRRTTSFRETERLLL